jgi:hypothetical protein
MQLTTAYPNTSLSFTDDVGAVESIPRILPFTSMGLQLINDSDNSIFLSLDGETDHFELYGKENLILDNFRVSKLFLRCTNVLDSYRLIVWPWSGEKE